MKLSVILHSTTNNCALMHKVTHPQDSVLAKHQAAKDQTVMHAMQPKSICCLLP